MRLTDLFKSQHPSAPVRAHMAIPAVPSGLSVSDAAVLRSIGVSRDLAMQVPTVAACRNLITGTIAQLVVSRFRGTELIDPGLLLTQPDPSTSWASTIQRTVDDLIFYGAAAWLVVARDGISTETNPGGLPVRARQVPVTSVNRIESQVISDYDVLRGYDIGGQKVDARDVIWFDGGTDGVLNYGARAIAQAYEIEAAARRMASVELPAGVLQNQGHELGPDEAADVVSAFQQARQSNTIAFLQNVEYQRTDVNSHDLQLVEARATSSTEIARLFNVPVALVGASPTGNASALLYSNLAQNTAQLVQQAVGPILSVLEHTLSLPTVTARGQKVRFEVGAYLRTDPEAAVTYATTLTREGLLSIDEARSYLGIPPQGAPATDITPGRV